MTDTVLRWLFVPRGCAVLYVPARNHHMIRTSLPTSWGFQPLLAKETASEDPKAFGELFKKVSTIDPTPYVCVEEALKFRQLTCGGEAKIRAYCENIAKEGGKRMAEILGTEVMDNTTHTLQRCCFVNVRLPLTITHGPASYDPYSRPTLEDPDVGKLQLEDGTVYIRAADASKIAKWMTEKSIKEYETMIPVKFYAGEFWCRISGQIYLELKDFEWAGLTLKAMCKRVSNGEFKSTTD
jgi:selenocysteine lyase/cysteine desulfurase